MESPTFATCLIAELGFLGLIVVTLVTIPFTCGHFFKIGVLCIVGLEYFKLGFLKRRRLDADCLHVANYNIKNCHDTPSQYISKGIPVNRVNSLKETSMGNDFNKAFENPNMAFIHERKKNEGANK